MLPSTQQVVEAVYKHMQNKHDQREHAGEVRQLAAKNPKNRTQIAIAKVQLRTDIQRLLKTNLSSQLRKKLATALTDLNSLQASGDSPITRKEALKIKQTFETLRTLADTAERRMPKDAFKPKPKVAPKPPAAKPTAAKPEIKPATKPAATAPSKLTVGASKPAPQKPKKLALDDTQVMNAIKPSQVKNADSQKIVDAAKTGIEGKPKAPPPATTKKEPPMATAEHAAVPQAAKKPVPEPPAPPAPKTDKTPKGITQRALDWLGLADTKQAGAFALLEKLASRFANKIASDVNYKMKYNKWSDLQSRSARLHSEASRYRDKRTSAGIPPRAFYDYSAKHKQMQDKADTAMREFLKLANERSVSKSHTSLIVLDELESPYA